MAAWARVDVLVIDDFLLRPLGPDQAADILEVIEDRAGLRSTIITSQLPVAIWHEALGDATIADAVMDRISQNAAPPRTRGRVPAQGKAARRVWDRPIEDSRTCVAQTLVRYRTRVTPGPPRRDITPCVANYRPENAKEVSFRG